MNFPDVVTASFRAGLEQCGQKGVESDLGGYAAFTGTQERNVNGCNPFLRNDAPNLFHDPKDCREVGKKPFGRPVCCHGGENQTECAAERLIEVDARADTEALERRFARPFDCVHGSVAEIVPHQLVQQVRLVGEMLLNKRTRGSSAVVKTTFIEELVRWQNNHAAVRLSRYALKHSEIDKNIRIPESALEA
jgi:hypothetical protein